MTMTNARQLPLVMQGWALVALLCAPLSAAAQTSIGTITLEGLSGAEASSDWPIYAFSQNISTPTSSVGRGAATPELSEIAVELDASTATPQLYAAIAAGTLLPRASIQLSSLERTGLGQETFQLIFDDVALTLTQVARWPAQKRLMSLSFTFARVAWAYTPRTAAGKPGAAIQGSWDLRTHTGEGKRPDRLRYVVSDDASAATPEEIAADQFSHSLARASTDVRAGAGSGAGKVVPNVVVLQAAVDSNVASHFVALVNGARLRDASVRVLEAEDPELRYDFREVQLLSMTLTAAAGGTLQEQLSFGYERIRWTIGPESKGWDFARNQRW